MLLPSVITVRGTRPSYEADAYRFAESPLPELARTGRFDPAQIAVMTGQAPPVYGSEPAAPGRAEAVERDWVRSVDRIEARASGGDAPEDARNYVEALRTEQEAQLPGWELARFVSRAHTAVGLPVVGPARTGDKVVPAFSPATIERLGESYPDLHAAVRTMDPASPLAHPGPRRIRATSRSSIGLSTVSGRLAGVGLVLSSTLSTPSRSRP